MPSPPQERIHLLATIITKCAADCKISALADTCIMICVDYHEEMGKRGFTCKVWIRIVKKKKKNCQEIETVTLLRWEKVKVLERHRGRKCELRIGKGSV